jgi:O-antigen/teichoic acid export membrane protein
MTDTAGQTTPANGDWAGRDDSVVRGTALYFIAKVVGGVFTGALTIFLARKIGSSGYGVFALALSVEALLFLVSDFGVIQAIGRFIAESRHDRAVVSDVVADGIRLKLLGSVVVGGALFACAPLVADAYGSPKLTWALRAIAVALLGKNLLLMGAAVFTAMRRQSMTLASFSIESAAEVVASVALVLAAGGAVAAAFGRAIGYLVGAAAGVVLMIRLFGSGVFRHLVHPRAHLSRIVGDAGALFVVDGAYTAFDQIDSLLIGAFLTVTAVGIWQAPLRLVAMLTFPGQSIASAVAPRMARSARHEPEPETFAGAVSLLLILMAAVIAVTTVWAEPIITLLLGPSFHGSAAVLRALAPFIFLAGIGPVVTVGMNYIGAARRRIPIALATTALNVVIDLILIPRIGVLGGAVGTDVAYLLYVPAHFLYCQRALDVPIRPIALTLVRSLLAAGVMALILATVGTRDLSIVEMLAGGALGLAAFAAMLLLTGEVSLRQVRELCTRADLITRRKRAAEPELPQAQPPPVAPQRESWVQLDNGSAWDDLLLPRHERDQLHAIVANVVLGDEGGGATAARPGLSALFVGPGGTGKTLAARVLGSELGRPVLQLDLQIASGLGGAQVRGVLDRVFADAAERRAIVVVDGVGALATPQLAASELLQRAKRQPGLVIFTWRPSRSLELWLPEQVDFLVKFPLPAAAARAELWRRALPDDARVSEGDIRYLARSFGLAGGAIRQCCETAVLDARDEAVSVGLPHLARALEREYRGSAPGEATRFALAHVRESAEHSLAGVERSTRSRVPGRAGSSSFGIRRWAMLALGASMAAAALGFAVGHRGGGSRGTAKLDEQASVGSLRVSLPSDWRRARIPKGMSFDLSDELAVAPRTGRLGFLVVGRAQTTDPGLLPASLVSRLAVPARAELISLGAVKFLRYATQRLQGGAGVASVYASPTTAGTIVGVCVSQSGGEALRADCERILATTRLASGTPLVPVPSPAYRSALSRAIATLDGVRSRVGSQLRSARNPATVANAATALAVAHREAASTVRRLSAGVARQANAALAAALQVTGDAYAALARAALRQDARAYSQATSALTHADAATNSALAQLNGFDYRTR